ncbi:MAG: hypothetical protein ACK4Q4_11160, partial [Rhodocyclaceae bacterium]
LGILAATALPKFIDLKSDAAAAAIKGAAGALTSASQLNYAAAVLGKAGSVALTANASVCSSAVNNLLQNSSDFTTANDAASGQFRYASNAGTCGTAGALITCGLTSNADTSKTATATVICTG